MYLLMPVQRLRKIQKPEPLQLDGRVPESPRPIQQRLLKFHGESSVEAIKANPYLLVGFGMAFEEVDALSQTKFEVELKDPTRLSAALEFTIHAEVEKGHTYTTLARLRPLLTKLLGDGELAAQAIQGWLPPSPVCAEP
uniref:Putative ATP-dependent exoDNAse n=1 Tax=Aeromonas hydrophila TaxID=644 RepID=Q6TP19_AERHY|nr:putative ATP-dependent exoDNAse [Aeromonas hydrophila]